MDLESTDEVRRRWPVIGVVGGSGGVGASSFAAVVAEHAPDALLVDLDVTGGGLDVLLGVESASGARWSGLQLAGGRLDPHVLRTGVVRWRGGAVLAVDVAALDPPVVGQVLEAAAQSGPVVVDLPRSACAERVEAVRRCSLVVVVVRADVSGMVAAHALVAGLDAARVGVVVRAGELDAARVAGLVGAELIGALPESRQGARPSRRLARLAAGVVRGVAGALVTAA